MGKVVALKDAHRPSEEQPATASGEGEGRVRHEDAQEGSELLEDLVNLDEDDVKEALELPDDEYPGLPAETTAPFPLSAKLSALLFTAPRPLTAQALAEVAQAPLEEVEEALEVLQRAYRPEEHGIALCEIAGAYQLRTVPALAKIVQRLIPPRAKRLSRAAAETLAVVAYKQPVQRAEIEAIRGVDALPTLKTLLDARLIRIVGREASAGQPALYGTTQTFLEKFGLRDLSELPTVRELAQLSAEPGEGDPVEDDEPLDDAGIDHDLGAADEEEPAEQTNHEEE